MGKLGESLLHSSDRKVLWNIFGPVVENGC